MSKLVENERRKLAATLLNSLSSGSIIVGFVTPTAAFWYGLGQLATSLPLAMLGAATFLVFGVCAHLLARQILGGLQE